MTSSTSNWRKGFWSLISGISTGLLVGTLAGLAVSSVVGSVLSVLLASVVTFLGLQSTSQGETGDVQNSQSTWSLQRFGVIGFGFACCCGVFFSLYVRTHDLLSPSVADQVRALEAAQFSNTEARAIVLGRMSTPTGAGASVLFSGTIDGCDASNPTSYPDLESKFSAMESGGKAWKDYVSTLRVSSGSTGDKTKLLDATWKLACGK
jgi:hypothetical protein